MQYFEHKEIDKKRWDDVLEKCRNRLPYACSWWLDTVTPGWSALADYEQGLLMPVPVRQKFGIHYTYMPPFTQQLGLFAVNPISAQQVTDALGKIPDHIRYGVYHLNETNKISEAGDWTIVPRVNIITDLDLTYEELQMRYANGHRRNLNKICAGDWHTGEARPEELIDTFRKHRGKETELAASDYEILLSLMDRLKQRGMCVFPAVFRKEELLAGCCLVRYNNRLIFLFSALSAGGRDERAMFYLIDHLLRQYAGQSAGFDFEGSMDPGLARFYLGFAGRESVYLQVKRNRLPWPLKLIKK